MSEVVYICERCREVVDPDDPDVIVAVEQVDVTAMGSKGPEAIDGLKVHFHPGCYPDGDPRYRPDP